jgi:hypothetical protein
MWLSLGINDSYYQTDWQMLCFKMAETPKIEKKFLDTLKISLLLHLLIISFTIS